MGYLDYAGLQHLWDKLKEKFAPKSHSHDDRYYTESEMDGKLNSKVNNNEAGANDLLSKLGIWTATPTDNTYFIRQDTGGTNQFGRVKFSTIWNYIKGKTDGVYQPKGSYAASGHTHDDRYYTEAEVDGKLEGKSSTDHTHDLSELISALSIGTSTTLNDAVQIITQDTDTANQKYYRRPLTVLWNYIKSKADSVYSAIGHTHKIQNLEDYTTRVYDATIVRPADTVLASPQDKDGIATFRKLDKNDVGLENVDNTADKNKNVATAGIATTGVRDYNNANNIIKIGWSGADLDGNTLAYIAGYTSDMKIHTASKAGVKQYLGINNVDNTADSSKNVNAANYHSFTHTDEINFTSGPDSQGKAAYIGYRNGEISAYRFCNGKANGGLVPIYASSFQGKATSAGTADSASNADKASGVIDYGNNTDLIRIGWATSSVAGDDIKAFAVYTGDGHKIKDANIANVQKKIGLENYLPLSGGTVTGRIVRSSGGSWISDRDRTTVYGGYPGDSAYGAVAGMSTKYGTWTIGNLGGDESLIFNYAPDANYTANKNETAVVRLSAQAGTIITSATIGNQTVNTATYANYLNFTYGNEINFNGTPDNNTVYVGYRNTSINEYRFNNGNGSSGLASITAAAFNGKATSAGSADSATTSNGVKDYNDGNRTIQIGFAGPGLNASNLNYIAGYTDNGTKIKDVNKDVLKSWIGQVASATSADNGVVASGYNYVRFGDGTQICWGQQDIADTGTTITFAVAFSSIPAVVNSGTEDIDDVFFVHNITTTNFVADKKGWYSGNNTWIAIGRWK